MANLVKIAEELEYVPKPQLVEMARSADSRFPIYMVLSEIQRRTHMEKIYNVAREEQPTQTVAEERVNEFEQSQGLAGAGADQLALANTPPTELAPASPMQEVAGGGRIRYQTGGYTDLSDLSAEEFYDIPWTEFDEMPTLGLDSTIHFQSGLDNIFAEEDGSINQDANIFGLREAEEWKSLGNELGLSEEEILRGVYKWADENRRGGIYGESMSTRHERELAEAMGGGRNYREGLTEYFTDDDDSVDWSRVGSTALGAAGLLLTGKAGWGAMKSALRSPRATAGLGAIRDRVGRAREAASKWWRGRETARPGGGLGQRIKDLFVKTTPHPGAAARRQRLQELERLRRLAEGGVDATVAGARGAAVDASRSAAVAAARRRAVEAARRDAGFGGAGPTGSKLPVSMGGSNLPVPMGSSNTLVPRPWGGSVIPRPGGSGAVGPFVGPPLPPTHGLTNLTYALGGGAALTASQVMDYMNKEAGDEAPPPETKPDVYPLVSKLQEDVKPFLDQAEGLDIARLGGIIMGSKNMSELGTGIAGLAESIQERRLGKRLSEAQISQLEAQAAKYTAEVENLEPDQLLKLISSIADIYPHTLDSAEQASLMVTYHSALTRLEEIRGLELSEEPDAYAATGATISQGAPP